ncbi:DUF3306 domain-containing protein [Tepidimonas aquatica]|uniref:DUF3306 domain-containing protein n=1 Tax=Tepidimonas aquatica TaxID=247482 RepID=A0A554WP98_9BURK|nr:DUF3306 domain-containing protein [Tepidimonas aquatica]TSE25389.1 hypothetical protein Taqua_01133 [Tepidimonas aquatica]
MTPTDESFWSRWSRRKALARQGLVEPAEADPAPAVPAVAPDRTVTPDPEPVPRPAAAPDAAADSAAPAARPTPAPPPPPTLEDVRRLTPQSDFQPFVRPEVAPEVRNAALRKLFADPHFNQMDGLDVYIDDYSRPDPLPLALAKRMAAAQVMGLFTEPAQATPNAPAAVPAVAQPPQPLQPQAARPEVAAAQPWPPGDPTAERGAAGDESTTQADHP